MPDEDLGVPGLNVLGARVDAIQIPDIIRHMENYIAGKESGNYIVVANVDTVVKCKFDKGMQEAVNASSLSIPDGFPLMLMGRLHGHRLKSRAYGPDLMIEFLKLSEGRGYTHFFYGATEETLNKLIKNIRRSVPGIKIAGFYAPPFRQLTGEEDEEISCIIRNAAPDVLWVGIGCPKQELWMYEHKDKLNIPVMIGVGAAFDFLAGTKPQAPKWIRDNGFEWLFRLATEPRRLWRRYLINNSLFVYYTLKDIFSGVGDYNMKRDRQ